jgi:type II secretory pathway pseudopilin PulG
MTRYRSNQQGISLPEVLVTMAITVFIVGAIASLIATVFNVTRREQEQDKTTNEARRALDRVSDELRGAQSIDWNGNGQVDDYYRNENWLLSGDEYAMEFYVYDDRWNETVKVRYYLEDTFLKRQVTRLGGTSTGCPQSPEPPTVIASGIRNMEQDLADGILRNEPNRKVFCYLPDEGSLGGCCLRMPVDLPKTVQRVRITFVVDTDTQQEPGEAVVQTAVSPRGGMIDWPLDGSVPQCADCIDNEGDGQVDFVGGSGLPAELVGCTSADDPLETELGYECDDGLDNDDDFLIDFRADRGGDPQCFLTTTEEEGGTACNDSIDNDGDGKIDFGTGPDNDPGCTDELDISELGDTECDDGLDNDTDGRIDYGTAPDKDPGCTDPSDNDERGVLQCDNGTDEDGDTRIDYPSDLKCSSPVDDSEFY